jgi:long-subunit fatty acid transport protein
VSYQLSKFITLEASAGMTLSDYSDSGTVADTSNFNSVTYQAGIQHTINKRLSHALRGGRSLSLGYGSNFTDMFNLQYSFKWLLSQGITLYGTAAYEDFSVSNGGEQAQRYLFNLGTSYQFTRQWVLGVNYAFSLKDSPIVTNEYQQNRLVLELTRHF